MNQINFVLGELDLTSYIVPKGIIEQPIYEDGVNVGKAKTGHKINDRVCTRYKVQATLNVLPQAVFEQIISACEANQVSVVYTSARSSDDVVMTAQCSLSSYEYGTTFGGTRYYYNCKITAEGI